jgi:HK97 family phage major capsid protein
MSKILELREKRAKAWDAAKAFLDTKRGNDGLLSAEDTATYEKMESDVVALGKEVERLERQAAIDAELNAPTSNAITNKPQRPGEDNKTGRSRDEYRRDFFAAMRGRPVTNVLSEGVDADGGYLVPTEFETTIVQGLNEDNVIRKLAKTITTSVERKVPIAATPSVATWVAENGAIPESGVTFDQKTLDAYKLTDLVKVSVELLADSMFNLEAYLAAEFSRAIGVAEEEAFCVGNGTGRPTGIFTASGGHVGATTSGAAVTFDDIISLVYSLKTPYRRNAVFLTNDSTVAAFRKLKDSNGQYLWQPALAQGQPDRLFGYPLYTSPYAPTIEAGALPVAFGDFSNYWIADRAGRTLQRLNELYAGNGQVGFLATERVDGKVILSEGIQLLQMAGA